MRESWQVYDLHCRGLGGQQSFSRLLNPDWSGLRVSVPVPAVRAAVTIETQELFYNAKVSLVSSNC